MEILQRVITKSELANMANQVFGDMVKAVVDIETGQMEVDAELHADLEEMLLHAGSQRKNLWGINLYPDADEESFIEFDSLINIRPNQNNRGRYVYDEATRRKISEVVNQWTE